MYSLSGKSIIVTGCASGIGKAAVMLAVKNGALVTAADVNEVDGRAVCDQVQGAGGQALFVRADISRKADVVRLVEAATSTYGRLDGAFNNAGIPNANIRFSEMPEEQFERMLAVNLTGVFLCMKYEIQAMERSGGGVIVNTSSSITTSMLPNMAEYAAAKYGILGLTRAAAMDHGRQGIRVNSVLPGPTRTQMFEAGASRVPGLEELLVSRQPLPRLCEAEEVAASALWLLSDEAAMVTGTCLPVDGGISIV